MDRRELRFRAAGLAGKIGVGGLFSTVSCERVDQEHYLRFRRERTPLLFVFWHGQLLPLMYFHRNEGIVALVSEHADGEYITRVLERHGFGVARGSSTRGGYRGVRDLLRAARDGRDLAITPDGPRGPRERFKWGALVAAQRAGLPIVPGAAGATRSWRLGSWDGFMVPKPFARVRIAYGPPVRVDPEADEAGLRKLAAELEAELGRLTRLAARVDSSWTPAATTGRAPAGDPAADADAGTEPEPVGDDGADGR